MATESEISDHTRAERHGDVADDAPRVRKRRVKVRRKQDKFPRPLRIMLMVGAPIALWAGIYLLGRALL